jgi:hypothetical protein
MNIHDTFTDRVDLARTYAKDGAFRTAGRILKDLGDTMIDHAVNCDAQMGATRTLGEFKGKPGRVLQTKHGKQFMTLRLAAGMIRSGNTFGGEETTAVVDLKTGQTLYWPDDEPVIERDC